METPKIESYRFGQIVVDGQTHTRDVIILPDRVLDGWWRQEGHALNPADLEAVFESSPDVLIVGQGAYGRMRVTTETKRALQSAGIGLVTQLTGEAYRTYNELRGTRLVAAALHLTC